MTRTGSEKEYLPAQELLHEQIAGVRDLMGGAWQAAPGFVRRLEAAGLFASFGLGHCAVITGAGTSVRRVQEYLQWSEDSRAVLIGRRVCGVLVLAGGLYFLYTAR